MTWVRLDDHFDEHPKLAAAGPFGIALFVVSIAYCNRNLTDGFVPRSAMATMFHNQWVTADQKLWTAGMTCGMHGDDLDLLVIAGHLVDVGLLEEATGGFRIHDYGDYQPSKDEVLQQREKNAERQRRWKEAKRGNGVSNGVSNGVANTTPVPVPVPEEKESPNGLLSSSHSTSACERRIFDHAAERLGHRWKFTKDRQAKIRARLRDGYSEDELLLVVDGVLLDPWEGRREPGNDDPKVIFRDGTHVDKFIAYAKGGNGNGDGGQRDAEERLHYERVEAMRRQRGWTNESS